MNNSSRIKPPPELPPREDPQLQFELDDVNPDPGVLSPSQFLKRASWHSTAEPEWNVAARENEWTVHSGTPEAAAEMDRFRGGGQFYPVLPKEVSNEFFQDNEANYANMYFDEEAHERPPTDSVAESAADVEDMHVVSRGAQELSEGRTIPYENVSEDVGSTSYISPAGGYDTIDTATMDMGLSPGYRPSRAHFTRNEMFTQGLLPPDIDKKHNHNPLKDPRLIEQSTSGAWVEGAKVQEAAQGRNPWAFIRDNDQQISERTLDHNKIEPL